VLNAGQFARPSSTIMSNVAAALWGCPGLSVGVHRYNIYIHIGAGIPDPQFNILKYLVREMNVNVGTSPTSSQSTGFWSAISSANRQQDSSHRLRLLLEDVQRPHSFPRTSPWFR
jgi:hypothetical protein